MDRLKSIGKPSRRDILNLSGPVLVSFLLVACGVDSTAPAHPTPSSAEIPWPQDAVLLFDQPDQRISAGGLELYQNGSKTFEYDPFEVYVSPSAFQAYVKTLQDEGVVKGDNVRFVYYFPGAAEGSNLICVNGSEKIVSLEMGRAIYKHVYVPHYKGQNLNDPEIAEKFVAEAQNQENLILFYEGQHIKHCREGLQDSAETRADAINAEITRARTLQPVFFLKLKPGADLNEAMRYIESLK